MSNPHIHIVQYQNLQTIIDNSLYRPENRISSFFFDSNNRRYNNPCLVTGTNRLTLWPIVKTTNETAGMTHSAPVVGAMYNETFDQVITGALDGSINVWDYSTGNIVFKFNKAHGMAKMTSMCLDFNQRRLVTGADDGSCKLWNFSNGQCLQRFGGSQYPQELTSVVFAMEQPKRSIASTETENTFEFSKNDNNNAGRKNEDKINNRDDCMKYILAAGWERRVFVYNDGNSDSVLQPFSHCMPPLSYNEKQILLSGGGKKEFRKTHNAKFNRRARPKSAHIQRRFGKNTKSKQHPLIMKRAIKVGPRPVSAAPTTRRVTSNKNKKLGGEGTKLYSTAAHTDDITCVCHCPPRMVASGGADGYIILWSLESGHCKWKKKAIDSHQHHHQAFDSLFRGNKSRTKKSISGSVEVLLYHEKLSTLISTGTDSQIRFWNVHVGTMLAFIDGDLSTTITSMILPTPNPFNDTYMFAGDSSGQIIIWHGDIDSALHVDEKNGNNDSIINNSDQISVSYLPQRPGTSLGAVINNKAHSKRPTRPISSSHYSRPFSAKARVRSNTPYVTRHRHITGETLAMHLKVATKWYAHTDEITSITYCNIRKHLITGSRDTRVSVWTLTGDHVGTFGQRNGLFSRGSKCIAWDIDDKKTWKSISMNNADFKKGEKKSETEIIEKGNNSLAVINDIGRQNLVANSSNDVDNAVDISVFATIEEKSDANSGYNVNDHFARKAAVKHLKENELRRETQLEEDLYKLKKINHYKRIYGSNNKISAEDQLFNMKQRYMSKKKDKFEGGWHGRAGKNNSDIWMQLHVPQVVDIPQNLGRFIHRPLREERLPAPRRKKKNNVRVKKRNGGYY